MRLPLNVTAIFDTQFILAETQDYSQDPAQPTPAPEAAVYLIADNAIGRMGGRRLVLPCQDGDVLTWRGLSLSGDADQSVVIYRIDHADGSRFMGPARAVSDEIAQPIPDSQSPTEYSVEPQYDYHMTTPVVALGRQITRLDFYIVDRQHSTLTTLGYFSWNAALVLVARDTPIEPPEDPETDPDTPSEV